MLGSAALRFFAQSSGVVVTASVRSAESLRLLPVEVHRHVEVGVNVENQCRLISLFAKVKPDVVINCVGLVKQLAQAEDPLASLTINAILPHQLARLCALAGSRLVHVSTDCVFSGIRGMYVEGDTPDARDLYGMSKYLGEVDAPNAITLRTSIIGHELGSPHGLVGWFLEQHEKVRGFTRAIFSGLPTVELARVIRDVVIPHPELRGVYHVSAAPISKFDLLTLIKRKYEKAIEIEPDDSLVINRSLDSNRFRQASNYTAPAWAELVDAMHRFG